MLAKPRLACVVDRFGVRYGGAEAYAVWLMQALAEHYEITVFARDYDPECPVQLPFVPVRSGSFWPSWVRVFLFALRARRLTRHGFNLVHSHMNGYCGNVEVVHVTPVRYNWRVRPLPLLKKLLSRISLRVQTYLWLESRRVAERPGHRVVAVSHLIARQLHEAWGQSLALEIIPPGVLAFDPDSITASDIRRQLGWGPEQHVCLLVARNPLRKGLPTLLAALLKFEQARLLVVGGDDATRTYVRQFADGRLAERVCVLDETSDVSPYYRVADSYIHPTLNDSFGMAPLEAMAFGLPVVLSPSPWCGFAHYVTPETEALVLDHPENADQLAAYIRKLAGDAGLRERLSTASRQVAARHSWDAVASRYHKLYQSLMAATAQ